MRPEPSPTSLSERDAAFGLRDRSTSPPLNVLRVVTREVEAPEPTADIVAVVSSCDGSYTCMCPVCVVERDDAVATKSGPREPRDDWLESRLAWLISRPPDALAA